MQHTKNTQADINSYVVFVPHDSKSVKVSGVFCPHYKLLPADVDCHFGIHIKQVMLNNVSHNYL